MFLSFLYCTDFSSKGGFNSDRQHITEAWSEMWKSTLGGFFRI